MGGTAGPKVGVQGTDQADGSEEASKVTTTLKGNKGERITKSLAKVEEKKKKRALRRAEVRQISCISYFLVSPPFMYSYILRIF